MLLHHHVAQKEALRVATTSSLLYIVYIGRVQNSLAANDNRSNNRRIRLTTQQLSFPMGSQLDASPFTATSICWSPDGRCVAIGLVDGGVLIHDVEPENTDDGTAEASVDLAGHHALHIIHPSSSFLHRTSVSSHLLSFNTDNNNDPDFKRFLPSFELRLLGQGATAGQ